MSTVVRTILYTLAGGLASLVYAWITHSHKASMPFVYTLSDGCFIVGTIVVLFYLIVIAQIFLSRKRMGLPRVLPFSRNRTGVSDDDLESRRPPAANYPLLISGIVLLLLSLVLAA